MPYISTTDKEREEMLRVIGAADFSELVADLPPSCRLNDQCLTLPEPLSELELTRLAAQMARNNKPASELNSFLGAGSYEHFIPAAVDAVISRPEFFSAYTPYQAEVSQGTLQAIYEYQTVICELTGLDIANAGMYDGASAAAEAALMACRKSGKSRVLYSAGLNPTYVQVMKVYTEDMGVELVPVPVKNGVTDTEALAGLLNGDTAGFLFQSPNFYGCIEDGFALETLVHAHKNALLVAVVEPYSLALLACPGDYKADIAVGEGQPLGNAMNYGGPGFGFMAARMELNRTMPGRIVGGTLDVDGKRAYALTLQAREQHIRRAKATSNICSNQALCSLAGLAHVCLLGPTGLEAAARQSAANAAWLAAALIALPGCRLAYNAPYFNEFVLECPKSADEIITALAAKGIYPGLSLAEWGKPNHLLIAVTETKTLAQMQSFVAALAEVL